MGKNAYRQNKHRFNSSFSKVETVLNLNTSTPYLQASVTD